MPNSTILLGLWNEHPTPQESYPYYAIARNGVDADRVRMTSYDLRLHFASFNPRAGIPVVPPQLQADGSENLYIVQFVTQPLPEFRQAIAALGGTVRKFLANHGHMVEMTPSVRMQVEALPFVRWVGVYHPAYRLEPFLVSNVDQLELFFGLQRYQIGVFEKGLIQTGPVAARIQSIGGTVDSIHGGGSIIEATLTASQLLAALHWDEVLFVNRWFPDEFFMDNARAVGGANYVETVEGFTGQGVRGAVWDNVLDVSHPDFQSNVPVLQGPGQQGSFPCGHGTSVYGIIFGDGAADAQARGMLPEAQGIFGDTENVAGNLRSCSTCMLIADDCTECQPICALVDHNPCPNPPGFPFHAVFESTSPRTSVSFWVLSRLIGHA